MKRRNYKRIFFATCLFVLIFLTSCSCGCGGNQKPLTLYAQDTTEKNLIEWVNTKLVVNPLQDKYKSGELTLEGLQGKWVASETISDVKKEYEFVINQNGTGTIKIGTAEAVNATFIVTNNNLEVSYSENQTMNFELDNQIISGKSSANNTLSLSKYKTESEILNEKQILGKNLITNYTLLENMRSHEDTAYKADIIENNDTPIFVELITKTTTTTDTIATKDSRWVSAVTFQKGCTEASNAQANKILEEFNGYTKKEVVENLSVNDVVCAYVIQVQERINSVEAEPLIFHKENIMGNFFSNFFVFPIAWLIVNVSKLFGGFYVLGLLIVTLLVRTAAWPVYAKTNDMSLKMQLMQPELNKIQEKYANRQDERSKQMQQMEMAQLYKKYKVGLGGCFLPFLQFPIFMAIYRAISRIPYTVSYTNTIYTNNWANELNSKFLGIDLLQDRTTGTGQLIGIIILMIIVVGTQFLSQWLSTRRQKKNQDNAEADIPEYRRKAHQQTQNSTQSSMKMMMYMMMLMMGLFVFTSKAGLGLYWTIGNIYSILQQEINSKTSGKRMDKLKNKVGNEKKK